VNGNSQSTSIAIWLNDVGIAEVVLTRGTLLTSIGFTRNGKQCLYIEETMYECHLPSLPLLYLPVLRLSHRYNYNAYQQIYDREWKSSTSL
jgi:hypothetical protein